MSGLFKPCPGCANQVSSADLHTQCICCLSPSHFGSRKQNPCPHCAVFRGSVYRDRQCRRAAWEATRVLPPSASSRRRKGVFTQQALDSFTQELQSSLRATSPRPAAQALETPHSTPGALFPAQSPDLDCGQACATPPAGSPDGDRSLASEREVSRPPSPQRPAVTTPTLAADPAFLALQAQVGSLASALQALTSRLPLGPAPSPRVGSRSRSRSPLHRSASGGSSRRPRPSRPAAPSAVSAAGLQPLPASVLSQAVAGQASLGDPVAPSQGGLPSLQAVFTAGAPLGHAASSATPSGPLGLGEAGLGAPAPGLHSVTPSVAGGGRLLDAGAPTAPASALLSAAGAPAPALGVGVGVSASVPAAALSASAPALGVGVGVGASVPASALGVGALAPTLGVGTSVSAPAVGVGPPAPPLGGRAAASVDSNATVTVVSAPDAPGPGLGLRAAMAAPLPALAPGAFASGALLGAGAPASVLAASSAAFAGQGLLWPGDTRQGSGLASLPAPGTLPHAHTTLVESGYVPSAPPVPSVPPGPPQAAGSASLAASAQASGPGPLGAVRPAQSLRPGAQSSAQAPSGGSQAVPVLRPPPVVSRAVAPSVFDLLEPPSAAPAVSAGLDPALVRAAAHLQGETIPESVLAGSSSPLPAPPTRIPKTSSRDSVRRLLAGQLSPSLRSRLEEMLEEDTSSDSSSSSEDEDALPFEADSSTVENLSKAFDTRADAIRRFMVARGVWALPKGRISATSGMPGLTAAADEAANPKTGLPLSANTLDVAERLYRAPRFKRAQAHLLKVARVWPSHFDRLIKVPLKPSAEELKLFGKAAKDVEQAKGSAAEASVAAQSRAADGAKHLLRHVGALDSLREFQGTLTSDVSSRLRSAADLISADPESARQAIEAAATDLEKGTDLSGYLGQSLAVALTDMGARDLIKAVHSLRGAYLDALLKCKIPAPIKDRFVHRPLDPSHGFFSGVDKVITQVARQQKNLDQLRTTVSSLAKSQSSAPSSKAAGKSSGGQGKGSKPKKAGGHKKAKKSQPAAAKPAAKADKGKKPKKQK